MTSFDKESSHVRLSPIIACRVCKIAYTSMRDCVGPLGTEMILLISKEDFSVLNTQISLLRGSTLPQV